MSLFHWYVLYENSWCIILSTTLICDSGNIFRFGNTYNFILFCSAKTILVKQHSNMFRTLASFFLSPRSQSAAANAMNNTFFVSHSTSVVHIWALARKERLCVKETKAYIQLFLKVNVHIIHHLLESAMCIIRNKCLRKTKMNAFSK